MNGWVNNGLFMNLWVIYGLFMNGWIIYGLFIDVLRVVNYGLLDFALILTITIYRPRCSFILVYETNLVFWWLGWIYLLYWFFLHDVSPRSWNQLIRLLSGMLFMDVIEPERVSWSCGPEKRIWLHDNSWLGWLCFWIHLIILRGGERLNLW